MNTQDSFSRPCRSDGQVETAVAPNSASSRLVWIILLLASFVVVGRLCVPLELSKDAAVQSEAAINLSNSGGLTAVSLSEPQADLAQPTPARPLTWFPPGYSILIWALTGLGLSFPASLKCAFTLVTFLGWLGWGLFLASAFVRHVSCPNSRIPAYIFCVLLPIYFTPCWVGTDIFLWAAVPWVIVLLFKCGDEARSPVTYAAFAGLLVGLAFGFRYASAFLFPASLAGLAYVLRGRVRALRAAFSSWGVGALVGVGPTLIYVRAFSQGNSFVPDYGDFGGTTFWPSLEVLGRGLIGASESLSANVLFVVLGAKIGSFGNLVLGLLVVVGILLLPFEIHRRASKLGEKSNYELIVLMAVFNATLVLFLIAMNFSVKMGGFSSGGGYLSESRLYWPVCVGGMAASYYVMTSRKHLLWVRVASAFFVASFVIYFCLMLPIGAALGRPFLRADASRRLLSWVKQPCHESRMGLLNGTITTSYDCCWQAVRELHSADQGAVFLCVGTQPFFYPSWSGEVPMRLGQGLKEVPPLESSYWNIAYSSSDLNSYWIVPGRSAAGEDFSRFLRGADPGNCTLREVARNDSENWVIYHAHVPHGTRFNALSMHER